MKRQPSKAGTFMATPAIAPTGSLLEQKLKNSSPGVIGTAVFGVMLVGGLIYIGHALSTDLSIVHSASLFPFLLLGIALFIALGFEFVNGFHDTANAVATCIYTHSLEPHIAVVYSGMMNFVGVLTSSGAGRLLHHHASARRAHPQSLEGLRLLDGLSHCSLPPSSGIWPPGGAAFPHRAPTP